MHAPAEIGRLLLSLTRRRVGPGAAEGRVGVLGALCEQLTAFAIALHSDIDSGVGSIGFRSVGVADRGWSSPGGMCGGMRERGSGGSDDIVAGEPGKRGDWAKAEGMWRPGRGRCDVTMCGGEMGECCCCCCCCS